MVKRSKNRDQNAAPARPRGVEEPTEPALKYDKGDRRKKHVGRTAEPEIALDHDQPRKFIGKCPRGLQTKAAAILSRSVAGSNGDRSNAYAKHRYAFYNGTIYEAATSDRGETYHGYPYHGKLAKALVAELRKYAVKENTSSRFDKWVDDHIEFHGSWNS